MVGGNDDLLRELLSMYLEESQTLVSQIATSIDSGNGAEIRRAAHTLGGASRSVGAKIVSEIAQQLRDTQDNGPFEQARERLAELQHSIDAVTSVIQSFLETESS